MRACVCECVRVCMDLCTWAYIVCTFYVRACSSGVRACVRECVLVLAGVLHPLRVDDLRRESERPGSDDRRRMT